MKQQDKLRATLREYYDNQEAPFSDEDWERASATLNASRRRTKSKAFVLAALFCGVIIAVFIFLTPQGNEKRQATSPRGISSKPALATRQDISSANKTFVQSADEIAVLPAPQGSSLHSNEDLKPAGKKSVASTLNTTKPANNENESKSVVSHSIIVPASFVNSPVNNNTTQNTVIEEQVKESPENTGAGVSETTPGIISPVAVSTANTTLNVNTNQDEIIAKALIEPGDSVDATIQPVVIIDKKEILARGTTKIAVANDTQKPAIADTLRNVPNTVTIAAIPATDTLPPSFTGEGIYYEAGGAGLYGWKGVVHREAQGFSPVIAIHYMNRINRRYSLSFGLQYLQVSGLSGSSKTSRVSSYAYGEQSRVTVITPASLYYIIAPLRLHYYTNLQNSFSAGINLSYLLNVDATVTSYDEKPGSIDNYSRTRLGGYTQGFSWFDSQVAAGYKRKIGRSFAVQAEIFIGLTDVKQDAFFGFSNKERNSGAKLSLIYYSFRKNNR